MTRIATPASTKPRAKEDPFRLGWRFIKETTPEGDVVDKQVPLTEEDVLHPQEYDFIVNTPLHDEISEYMKLAIRSRHAHRKDVVVIGDTRIDWGSKYGWAHGPDVAMFTGVKGGWGKNRGTFFLAKTKGKVRLVIEATSPTTRGNDFGYKLRESFLVGIPVYVIIDIPEEGQASSIQLYGYQAGKNRNQYEPMTTDERGRLWLDAAGLWLGVAEGKVYLEDEQGNRLPDYEELVKQLEGALTRAAIAEAKVRELEAKLARRTNGKRPNGRRPNGAK